MKIQDLTVRQTQKALGDFLRAVESLPEDRRDWSPVEVVRSAMSMVQEVAVVPEFHLRLISGQGVPPELHAELQAKAAQLRDFESGREAALHATSELCQAILSFPDDRLDDEVTLPFGPGVVFTMAEVIGLHYWNLVYHFGQVNYIQTALGDREMH
ncbi:MAG: hypothetical protein KF824_04390 [Fimbriimonadaceae bacterium]|nr:MAG: hypothetical protein KF824_04390 [Fimbriimonadaceae bacterium]